VDVALQVDGHSRVRFQDVDWTLQVGNFCTRLVTVSFSRRAMFYGLDSSHVYMICNSVLALVKVYLHGVYIFSEIAL
jgi:hypothetical protein